MIKLSNLPMPISQNKRMTRSRTSGRMIKSLEARNYASELGLDLDNRFQQSKSIIERYEKQPLAVDVYYCGPKASWFTKDGGIRKRDVDNYAKIMLDVVFPFLGLDDSQIFVLNQHKETRENYRSEFVDIRIRTYVQHY